MRFETLGWSPVYGQSEAAGPDAEDQHEYVVRFTEQMIMSPMVRLNDEVEHARPLGVTRTAGNKLVEQVSLAGSDVVPILGIAGSAPAGSVIAQFAVDSTGRVDMATISIPAEANPKQAAAARSILPRMRFDPARENGKPVCELIRMQVNFSHRRDE